ncbi:MAG: magnesium transporter [Candidatus Sumerlaeia bacterium]|nr:magnesium transporter [Candidatus Sumerlaeia bacterium]
MQQPDHIVELRARLDAGDPGALLEFLETLPADEKVFAVASLSAEEEERLLRALPPEAAARILNELPDFTSCELVRRLEPEVGAAILDEMRSDRQADLLGGIAEGEREALISALPEADALRARQLLNYAPDTAGGLMATEYLAFPEGARVGDVLRDLRANHERYTRFEVQYSYLLDGAGRLTGVLPMRELLFASEATPVRGLVRGNPKSVGCGETLANLRLFFDEHRFLGVPVVDPDGRLVGVVQRAAVQKESAREANRLWMRVSGIVGGEELRTMPLRDRTRRRGAWLGVNLLLNMGAATAIAFFEDTLTQVIALAMFLPIISDMSGCSGNQAVAVSMREMVMGVLRPRDAMRVAAREVSVGAINGVLLGSLLAIIAILVRGDAVLGLVVGAALALNTVLAVMVGGTLPLLVKALRLDPALVAGPILTTVTDLAGFVLVLWFATMALPYFTLSG